MTHFAKTLMHSFHLNKNKYARVFEVADYEYENEKIKIQDGGR